MNFPIVDIEEWKARVNAELKKATYEDFRQEVKNEVVVDPYYESQNDSEQSTFNTQVRYLSNALYQSPYSDGYIGEISDYLKTLSNKGKVLVNSVAECVDIEENYENNEFEYWVDLFKKFETIETEQLDLDAEYSQLETLSDNFNSKLRWVINIAVHQNCGASYTSQLSVALAKLNELISHFTSEILPQIIIKVGVGTDFIREIAKLRALRQDINLFYQTLGKEENQFKIFIEPTHINILKQDPENNLIRTTLELAAGIMGGADLVYNYPYTDQKDANWTQDVAVKQCLIASQEAMLDYYNDALAGSNEIERMTFKLAQQSWIDFQEIEKNGGYDEHFATINHQIYEEMKALIESINKNEKTLVGLNKFNTAEFKPFKILKEKTVLQTISLQL